MGTRILRLPSVRSWELTLDPAVFAHDRSYRAIISRLYGEWARKENKTRWGDKTPQYVTEIPTLLELFPAARAIHIHRDGRDVALSWLRARFGPSDLLAAASAWKRFVSHGRRVGLTLPSETYLEISYEALLGDATHTMRRVCAFVGEPFDEAVLKPNFMMRTARASILGTRPRTWIADSEIVSANVGKWKKDMSLADRVLFESVAGGLLESLGYEIEGNVRRISRAEELMWTVHHQVRWLLYRLNTRGLSPAAFFQMQWAELRYQLHTARYGERG